MVDRKEKTESSLPILDLEKLAREVDPRNPASITEYWRKAWGQDGNKVNFELSVPDFPDNPKGLAWIEVLGGGPIFVPPEISKTERRHLLGQMYPEMAESRALQNGNPFSNGQDHSGWRYVAIARHSPYLGTCEGEMVEILKVLGAESINLTELVIAAKYSQRRTGHFLDERTWLRIPNSCGNTEMVAARFFHPESRLCIVPDMDMGPQLRCIRLGFRWSLPVPNFASILT